VPNRQERGENWPTASAQRRDLVDEVVVVDTVRQTRPRKSPLVSGAKVFDFLWVDSFAAARTKACATRTGNRSLLAGRRTTARRGNAVRLRTCRGPGTNLPMGLEVSVRYTHAGGIRQLWSTTCRLFRNRRDIRWSLARPRANLPPSARLAARSAGPTWCQAPPATGLGPPAVANWTRPAPVSAGRGRAPEDPFTLFNLARSRVSWAIALLRYDPCAVAWSGLAPGGLDGCEALRIGSLSA